MKMSLIDAISVNAYALAISLIESLIICLFWVLLAAVLPERLFRKKFVPHTMILMLVTSVWAANGQINYQTIYDWTFAELLPWLALYLGSCLVFYFLVQHFDRLANLIYRIVQWISVLATLYISLGVIGFVIVVLRNI